MCPIPHILYIAHSCTVCVAVVLRPKTNEGLHVIQQAICSIISFLSLCTVLSSITLSCCDVPYCIKTACIPGAPCSYSLSSETNFHPLSGFLFSVSPLLSPLLSSTLQLFFCVCPLSNFLWFCHHVFVSMSSFLPHVSCLFGDKPRERDFLKTLRLVSGTEACAVEQHGETVDDDDKGVRVACPPLKKHKTLLTN